MSKFNINFYLVSPKKKTMDELFLTNFNNFGIIYELTIKFEKFMSVSIYS